MTCKEHIWFKSWITGEWMCSECEEPYEAPEVPELSHVTPFLNPRLGKRQMLVLDVLRDGEWHDGPELTHPEVGGSEGLRRLRELREKGYDIEMRKKAKGRTTRQYRLSRARTED